jgi:hypothetical protein
MVIDPVYLIVGLIFWGIVGYAAKAIIPQFAPPPIANLIFLLLAVLFLLWLLNALGLVFPTIRIGRAL